MSCGPLNHGAPMKNGESMSKNMIPSSQMDCCMKGSSVKVAPSSTSKGRKSLR